VLVAREQVQPVEDPGRGFVVEERRLDTISGSASDPATRPIVDRRHSSQRVAFEVEEERAIVVVTRERGRPFQPVAARLIANLEVPAPRAFGQVDRRGEQRTHGILRQA
jgi:hypothetical protein